MGFGDEIMAAAEAQRMRGAGKRVEILDRNGKRRWHALWEGSDIARPGEAGDFTSLVNGPGCRPYVDYVRMAFDFAKVHPARPFTTKVRNVRLPWRYTDWRCVEGRLPSVPRRQPGGYVVVEPHVKGDAQHNKRWKWQRWQALLDARPDFDWVQVGPRGTRLLHGARHMMTANFESACTVLSGAAAAVLPEGGLHHAAAALGVPAVVIFGGMTSPENTGYECHTNLFDQNGASPCGQRVPCGHCDRAMATIKPETVARHLEAVL